MMLLSNYQEDSVMRKFLLVLMALCLAVVPALAETAEPTALDFGDFTMTIPADMQYEMADEITDNATFFMLYQPSESAFTTNMALVWSEAASDLTAADPQTTGEAILATAQTTLEAQSVAVANPTLVGASMDEIGGKTALSVVYTMDLDYTGMGVDLQTNVTFVQAIVSEDAIGTYTFTIASDSMDGCQPLVEVVNTVVWAE